MRNTTGSLDLRNLATFSPKKSRFYCDLALRSHSVVAKKIVWKILPVFGKYWLSPKIINSQRNLKILMTLGDVQTPQPVSYTHLDVYKRQCPCFTADTVTSLYSGQSERQHTLVSGIQFGSEFWICVYMHINTCVCRILREINLFYEQIITDMGNNAGKVSQHFLRFRLISHLMSRNAVLLRTRLSIVILLADAVLLAFHKIMNVITRD